MSKKTKKEESKKAWAPSLIMRVPDGIVMAPIALYSSVQRTFDAQGLEVADLLAALEEKRLVIERYVARGESIEALF